MECDFPPRTESVALLRLWQPPSVLAEELVRRWPLCPLQLPSEPRQRRQTLPTVTSAWGFFFFSTPQRGVAVTVLPVPFSGTFTRISGDWEARAAGGGKAMMWKGQVRVPGFFCVMLAC